MLMHHSFHENACLYAIQVRKLAETCTGVFTDGQNSDRADIQFLSCETPDGKFYKVKNAPKNFIRNEFKKKGFKSGDTELLFGDDALVDEDLAEISSDLPPGLAKKNRSSGRKLYAVTTGDISMLVVRVIARNGSSPVATTASQSALSDSVFGNNGDPVNLKSQYAACSHNKLRFQEAIPRENATTGATIAKGSTTIAVTTDISQGDAVMRNDITNAIKAQFGVSSPNQLAKHGKLISTATMIFLLCEQIATYALSLLMQ